MFAFLASPQNTPFSVALAVMIMIALLEAVSVAIGAGISHMIDSAIPDLDADLDLPDHSTLSLDKVLHWFRIGEVPALMLLVIFLTVFGLTGLVLQWFILGLAGTLLPPLAATIPAFVASLPAVRVLGGFVAKYMPKDETYVISEKSLIGRVATILAGTARPGRPVQAKLKDEYGQTHYIMVEPDSPDETFTQGEKIIIVSQHGAVFRAIRSSSEALTDN